MPYDITDAKEDIQKIWETLNALIETLISKKVLERPKKKKEKK